MCVCVHGFLNKSPEMLCHSLSSWEFSTASCAVAQFVGLFDCGFSPLCNCNIQVNIINFLVYFDPVLPPDIAPLLKMR